MSDINKELLEQVQALTAMVVDLTIRAAATEKVLFTSGATTPGDFAETVKQLADEFGSNVAKLMEQQKNA